LGVLPAYMGLAVETAAWYRDDAAGGAGAGSAPALALITCTPSASVWPVVYALPDGERGSEKNTALAWGDGPVEEPEKPELPRRGARASPPTGKER